MNSKKILSILFLLIIVGIQTYYFATIHQNNKMKVENIKQDIRAKQTEVNQLKTQLKILPETKEKFLQTQMKVTALTNKIPSQMSSAREFADMIRMMQTSNFAAVTIKTEEKVDHTYENKVISECKYVVKYIAPFSQSQNFIKSLNQSDQLLNISDYKVANTPQTDKEKEPVYRYLYEDSYSELVESEVKFSVFVNPERVEEIYDPSINLLTNSENTFFNVDTLIKKEEKNQGEASDVVEPKENIPLPTTSQQARGTEFEIDIMDILTSGDTYSISGPDDLVDRRYAGIVGHEDVTIRLKIKKQGYTMSLENASGQVVQKEGITTVKSPIVNIFSTMKPIEENMPHAKIYITNETKETAKVTLEGKMLDHITIYDENGQVLSKGQMKGNIEFY